MPAAILFITVGGIMVYSALTGVSVADALAGVVGITLDPRGGDQSAPGSATGGSSSLSPQGTRGGLSGGTYGFKGPNAAALAHMADTARSVYHLTITSTSGGGHVTNSWHYRHRAFDADGLAADRAAYARWAASTYGDILLELFYSPAGITIKNGKNVFPAVYDKPNHVHTAA
jgi:hypothetical protein